MADGIKIGNLDISAFKVGSGDCKVYLGDALLYPNVETRVIATFNVTDTSEPTQLFAEWAETPFSAIEIDGVEQQSVVNEYTFDTTGEHTVKYTLTDSTSIGESAFDGCSDLTSIIIPSSVTSIGDWAFYDCINLTSITIPSGVTSIGEEAFYECSSLTSVNIPNSVTSVGEEAFYDTPWWDTYSADTSHQYGNIIYINDIAYKAAATGITSVTFRSGTVNISSQAFISCTSLTSINMPDSVTSIGSSAFHSCSGLTSIDIPSGVTSIGEYTFNSCSGLTSVTVNATTPPTLGEGAFNNNASGRKIYVPSASVNDYKAASGWSTYANDIEPIS